MCCSTRVAIAHELPHGHAMSLNAKQPSVLRVTSGRLYVTTNQSPEDYFLAAGDTLDVPAGAHAVVETWNQNKSGVAVFDWIEQGAPEEEITSQHPPSPAQTSAA
ncbi:MAG: DUF2917 domain-containing protein [Cytophagales bacterium]|nr:DUF2917 domain-containing protein [Cytophagales bacterium]